MLETRAEGGRVGGKEAVAVAHAQTRVVEKVARSQLRDFVEARIRVI